MKPSLRAPHLVALGGAFAVALLAPDSRADSSCPWGIPCHIGPNGKVVITPPPVTTTVGGSVGGSVGGGVQTGGGFSVPTIDPQIELNMRARWDAYFQARAALRLQIRANVEAEVYTGWRQRWQQTPDPYVGWSGPGGGGGSTSLGIPIISLAFVCYGVWVGPVPSSYIGFCPFVRFGLTSSLALEVGVNVFAHDTPSSHYFSAHLHPALLWSFIEGTYASGKGARGYLRAGLDAGLPWGGDGRTPDAFAGGEVGIGVETVTDGVGFGTELRGQVRHGFASPGDPGYDLSRWHAGLEQRLNLIFPF